MDRNEINTIIDTALARLIDEQVALLDLDVTERSLSHHLAIYLSEIVPGDYDVDAAPLFSRCNPGPIEQVGSGGVIANGGLPPIPLRRKAC
jgi:hypothetical protein